MTQTLILCLLELHLYWLFLKMGNLLAPPCPPHWFLFVSILCTVRWIPETIYIHLAIAKVDYDICGLSSLNDCHSLLGFAATSNIVVIMSPGATTKSRVCKKSLFQSQVY